MLNISVSNAYFKDLATYGGLVFGGETYLIWNMDETSVPLLLKPSRVLAQRCAKNIPGSVGNQRDNVSVLACINAAGGHIPPLCIVKGKTPKALGAYNVHAGPTGTRYTYQERAWMENILGEV